MYSVSGRIAVTKQPHGGFIKSNDFTVLQFDDKEILYEEENINPGLVGTAVDYLTRFTMGTPKDEAFKISLLGARLAKEEIEAKERLEIIKGLDPGSVYYACQMAGYDAFFRAPGNHPSVSDIDPSDETIYNIIRMVSRGLKFWEKFGPIVLDGFTFEGGYSPVVSKGDGYLTKDTIWDFKVSKRELTSRQTLQLLMYYIMGRHSTHKEFDTVKYIGIFNPRQNKAYRCSVEEIPEETIKTVSHDVIGYGWTKEEYDALERELDAPFEEIRKKRTAEAIERKAGSLKAGDLVEHPIFGKGKILSIKKLGNDSLIEVELEKFGIKKMILSYARLRVLKENM